MRWGIALGLAVLLAGPRLAWAQDCPDCVLGLYADAQLTQTQLTPQGASVDVYLGIRYGSSVPQELTGIEFTVAGLDSFLVITQPLDNPTVALGSPAAPAGQDSVYGHGGMNIAWGQCLPGNRPLVKFTLIPRRNWPAGTALRVKRRYPPANPSLPYPLLTHCDDPFFTPARVEGGTFTLGPAGEPQCATTVPEQMFPLTTEGESTHLRFTLANTGGGVMEGMATENCPEFEFYGEHSFSLAHGQSKNFQLQFSPLRPGPVSCVVDLGSCGSIEFTGRAPEVIPIADVYAGGDSLLGHKVAIEGQVTVTPLNNYGPWYLTGWLQDHSGRGLPVTLPRSSNTELRDRGNWVRASGTLKRKNGVVSLAATGATVLEQGRPFVAPVLLPAAEAARSIWQGTLVEIEGRLVAGHPGELYYMRYDVVDSSGAAVVLAPERLPVGGSALARGAAWGDSTGALFVGDPGEFVLGPECGVRRLSLGRGEAPDGSRIVIPMRLDLNRAAIDSLRVVVNYDSRVTRFVEVSCSGLAATWPPPAAETTGPGAVLVTAAGSPAIAAASSGEILRLTFEIIGCAPRATDLTIVDLGADVASLAGCPGWTGCADCRSNGDVNQDGVLTPGDAQCAFEIFLSGDGAPPPCDAFNSCAVASADVSCDLQVTPGDALMILRRWLVNDATPRDCPSAQAPGAGTSPASVDRGYFRVNLAQVTRIDAARVVVPVEMRALAGAAAFGADLTFDPTQLQFVELRRDAAGAGWHALQTRTLGAGRVRIGGFVADREPAVASAGWIPVAQLVFDAPNSSFASLRAAWLEQISGEVHSAPVPDRLFMREPRPNPVVRTSMFVDLAIPAGTAQAVVAQVMDVRGRRVRTLYSAPLAPGLHTLHWDVRDAHSNRVAAGVYVLEVQFGRHIERHKLVVVE